MKKNSESGTSNKTAMKAVAAVLGVGMLGALLTAPASAACMDPKAASGQPSLHQSPLLSLPAASAATAAAAGLAPENGGVGPQRIVGTWLVSYAAGGSVYGEAFIQWHSDGTEWENVDFPILGGNICLGSWKPAGYNKVSRFHVGWLYQDGVLFGHFTETETDTLSRDGNSYTGNNDTKMYTLDGTMFNEVVGTSSATRIAP